MKIVLTERQFNVVNESKIARAIDLITSVGEEFQDEFVNRVELEGKVRWDNEKEVFFITPTIYFTKETFSKGFYKHILSDYIQTTTGLPVQSYESVSILED